MKRRSVLQAAAAAAWPLTLPAGAQPAWPTRSLRHIVPFPSGGITDILARRFADKMSGLLGQTMVVDNRGGAAGIVGVEAGSRAAPDGYTTLDAGIGTHVFNAMIYRKLPYNPLADFTPVTVLSRFTPVLMTTASSGLRTVKDVVDNARAKPGSITFSSSGVGSPGHILIELFQQAYGIQVLHVPYAGGAPAFASMMADTTQAIFDFPFPALSFIQAGRIVPVAVTGSRRLKLIQQVPTMRELQLPELEMPVWRGLFLPRNAPRAVVDRLAADARTVMAMPDIVAHCDSAGVEPDSSSPEEFAQLLRSETERWRPVIQKANIRLEI